ncbi:hypothetical protein I7X30_00690 [Capnocytophaga sp. 051621]|uniref:Uncharacterized protein n=1 Tax=Capnocytophaga periodontitidis TaxID=2795027 RepID=A0ABS0SJX9_9FLAO|nr:hypothetical protein [Capnocytophaga periodontitidis]MBI1645578.1 hypothetical protein [Capnocytophaga periodontitidis]
MKTIVKYLVINALIVTCLSSFTERNKQYQTEDIRMDIVLINGDTIPIIETLNHFYENKAKVVKVSSAKIKVDIKTCGKSDVDKICMKFVSMDKNLKKSILSCGTAYVLEQNGKTSTKEFNCGEQQNVVLKVKILKILELSTGEYYNLMVIDK